MVTVAWFSAGVSSAVATKLMIDQIDRVIYTHINDQDADTMRFIRDCEQWFGKEVQILQSPYKTVEAACMSKRYINGVAGAACTGILKRDVRKRWEYEQPLDQKLRYVWGMDCNERKRRDDPEHGLIANMPNQDHICPLIDLGISKEHAHEILSASGIKRPAAYKRYRNNNCRGCVKGGKGYWNRVRRYDPEIFWQRAAMERKIGASCINGVYLDELDPKAGRKDKLIMGDCGILCELMAL